jgi:hypothetical protein
MRVGNSKAHEVVIVLSGIPVTIVYIACFRLIPIIVASICNIGSVTRGNCNVFLILVIGW